MKEKLMNNRLLTKQIEDYYVHDLEECSNPEFAGYLLACLAYYDWKKRDQWIRSEFKSLHKQSIDRFSKAGSVLARHITPNLMKNELLSEKFAGMGSMPLHLSELRQFDDSEFIGHLLYHLGHDRYWGIFNTPELERYYKHTIERFEK